MPEPGSDWSITELTSDHDRSTFSCGHASLDEFLRRFAGQNQRSGISRTYVATRRDEPVVLGDHSISAGAVSFGDIRETLRQRLPRHPGPVAPRGPLAVDMGVRGSAWASRC